MATLLHACPAGGGGGGGGSAPAVYPRLPVPVEPQARAEEP